MSSMNLFKGKLVIDIVAAVKTSDEKNYDR